MSGVLRSSLGLRPASKTHLRKTRLRRTQEIPEVVFKPFQAAGLRSESDKKPGGSLEPGPAPRARQPSPTRATSPLGLAGLLPAYKPLCPPCRCCLEPFVPWAHRRAHPITSSQAPRSESPRCHQYTWKTWGNAVNVPDLSYLICKMEHVKALKPSGG